MSKKAKKDNKAKKEDIVADITGLDLMNSSGVLYDNLVLGAVVALDNGQATLACSYANVPIGTVLVSGIIVSFVDKMPKKWFAARTRLPNQASVPEAEALKTQARFDKARVMILPLLETESSPDSVTGKVTKTQFWGPLCTVKVKHITKVFGPLSGTLVRGRSSGVPWMMTIKKAGEENLQVSK